MTSCPRCRHFKTPRTPFLAVWYKRPSLLVLISTARWLPLLSKFRNPSLARSSHRDPLALSAIDAIAVANQITTSLNTGTITITNSASTDSNFRMASPVANSPPVTVVAAAAAAPVAVDTEAYPPNGLNRVSDVDSAPSVEKQPPSPDSPPPQIVSDLPSVNIPSTALAAAASAGQVPQASKPGSSSRGGSPRHPHSPAYSSSATTIPSQTRNGSSVGRWAAKPSHPHHSQSQSHHRSPAYPAASSSTPTKIPIIDAAPGIGTASAAPSATSGFPSPGKESLHQNVKFKDDRTRITFSIRQALPEAVRRSVRDDWEKCLLGSEFHQAFIVSSCPVLSVPVDSILGGRD